MAVRLSEDASLLTVERRFYTDYVRLTLERGKCIFCDVCIRVCPKNAIRLARKEDGSLTLKISEECSLCGACEPFCPTSAITMTVNGKRFNPLVSSGGFPVPLPKIRVDQSKCRSDCFECSKACPTGALKIDSAHNLRVDEEKCLRCPWSEDACPEKAVKVNPLFEGTVFIDESKCEEKCDACVEACPTKAISKTGGVISVNPRYCILCNACVHLDVCRNHAITVVRRRVLHGEGFSAVWANALENLLGGKTLARELDAEGYRRIRRLIEEARL
ncbi:MAG: 4Fe-4S dicluster domain-containing protein [Candidatus Brockarchaeota archaeon]|nr:4Fe-4S dicluster domain-containing protein [Candidatus Brockarchaeota archaeon]